MVTDCASILEGFIDNVENFHLDCTICRSILYDKLKVTSYNVTHLSQFYPYLPPELEQTHEILPFTKEEIIVYSGLLPQIRKKCKEIVQPDF